MPVTSSAKKKLRQDKKREKINLVFKKRAKDAISQFLASPNEKKLAKLFSGLDQLSKKKIYHSNKVARLKSRLAKLLNKKSLSKSTNPSDIKKRPSRKKKSVV